MVCMYPNDTNLTKNSIRSLDSSIESTQRIFFELASDQRLSILLKLERQQSNLSKLAKHLDVTIQEVHRNLNRLMDAGLIEKDPAGLFSLTTFGNIIINQIPPPGKAEHTILCHPVGKALTAANNANPRFNAGVVAGQKAPADMKCPSSNKDFCQGWNLVR
jgi:hypothetical protein